MTQRTLNNTKKVLYRISFVTGFTFEVMLTEKELHNMIRNTKMVGYKKIENNPLTN